MYYVSNWNIRYQHNIAYKPNFMLHISTCYGRSFHCLALNFARKTKKGKFVFMYLNLPSIYTVRVRRGNEEKSNNLSPFEIANIYFKNILLKNRICLEEEANEICIYVKVKNKLHFLKNINDDKIIDKLNKFLNKIIKLISEFFIFLNNIDNSNAKLYITNFLMLIKNEAYKNINLIENENENDGNY